MSDFELPIEPPEPRYERPERDEDEVYQEYKDARLERKLEALGAAEVMGDGT